MNEIGDRLKEARKAKGYSLDDLQQKTKIQKRYLIAVEEGNFDILPGDFYARAFIKQYADSVGLNGEDLMNEHMDVLPETSKKNYSKSIQKTQTRKKAKDSGFVATIKDSFPTILIVVLVIAIIFAIYLAVTAGDNTSLDSFINEDESSEVIEVDNNEEAASNQDEAADDQETAEEQTDDKETADEEKAGENAAENQEQVLTEVSSTETATTYTVSGALPLEQTIVLRAEGGQSWSSINVDGETSAGLIVDGETLSAQFDDTVNRIDIVIGNASVTDITLNDQQVPYNTSGTEAVRQEVTIEFE
ncbi:helix-turn-helix domain-containing protein [Alkalibacterium kapii]|uniref:XRE family transcriptional regulator n=1 Tax=Alkalibacterium kapii TaxID=426704 RepID=A0A511B0Y9_9LACT|nr:RodZ domain-containing protein [Alkalibacterium kapii]GEK91477.1 XRE family transcriptional regulator [Alkalibacterium kapii]